MRYCRYCGSQISDEAVVCVHCGCFVKNEADAKGQSNINNDLNESGNNSTLIICILGLVLCWIPIIGLILSLIGLKKASSVSMKVGLGNESDTIQASKGLSITGVICSFLFTIVRIVIILFLTI